MSITGAQKLAADTTKKADCISAHNGKKLEN
jgi:hypothetical protein